MPSIFLCHASEDKPAVEPVQLALASAGYEVFYDRQSLPAGADYQARIRAAILQCDLFVFMASPASVAPGRFTLTELRFARERWPSPVDRVLPVLIGALTPSQLPPYLQAVTVLTAEGNLAAEVRAAAEAMVGRLMPPDVPPPFKAPRCGGYDTGPLTLAADLPGHTRAVEAYPTGPAGMHCVFSIYNDNPVDFVVLKLDVEVLSYQSVALEKLCHGVGATAVSQQYRADLSASPGRYPAWKRSPSAPGHYVKLTPREAEVFDVEVTTPVEGLYRLNVHVAGSVGHQPFTASMTPAGLEVFFFARGGPALVDRGHGGQPMRFSDYIDELVEFDDTLRPYGGP